MNAENANTLSKIQNDSAINIDLFNDVSNEDLELYLCGKSFKHFLKRTWKLWDTEHDLIWTTFHDTMCDVYQAIHDGKINRVIQLQPPRTAKTVFAKAFIAFHTLHYPWKKWIFASHSSELIAINMKSVRRVMDPKPYEDQFYIRLKAFWGADWDLRWDEKAGTNFSTTRGGRWFGTTPEAGSITGFDADGLLLDDLLDTTDVSSEKTIDKAVRWLRIAALRRFRNRDIGIVISIAQTIHPLDPPNWLKRTFPKDYDVYTFPMEYEPGREDEIISSIGVKDWRSKPGELLVPEYIRTDHIPGIKLECGPMAWDSQYQQRARIVEFPRFPRECWDYLSDEELIHIDTYGTFYQTIMSVDTAYGRSDKSDNTAITVVCAVTYPDLKTNTQTNRYIVLDCKYGPWDEYTGIQKMMEMWQLHNPDNLIIELEANGGAYIDEAVRSGLPVIHGKFQHYAGKPYRADAASSPVRQKLVAIPANKKWSEDFITIAEAYTPTGTYNKDVIDSFSQGLIWIQMKRYFDHPLDIKLLDLEKRMKKNEVNRWGVGAHKIKTPDDLFANENKRVSILDKEFGK